MHGEPVEMNRRNNSDSDDLHRSMALHYLIENKKSKCFRARLHPLTIQALEARGCIVDPSDDSGVNTVRCSVPFGRLVTKEELNESRSILIKGIGIFLAFKPGLIAVVAAILHFHAGLLSGVIWFISWILMVSVAFLLASREMRVSLAIAALFLCFLGYAVKGVQ